MAVPTYVRADRTAENLPARAWQRLSAGAGAKGERLYDWALTPLWRLQITAEERRFGHYLLVRRSLDEKRERAYYVVCAPRRKPSRHTLVNVAGRRWEIEIGFEAAKGECGLDQYEVRRWQGWYAILPSPCLSTPCSPRFGHEAKKLLMPYRVGVHRILPPTDPGGSILGERQHKSTRPFASNRLAVKISRVDAITKYVSFDTFIVFMTGQIGSNDFERVFLSSRAQSRETSEKNARQNRRMHCWDWISAS
nr:transposase [Burkholderia ubonensis]